MLAAYLNEQRVIPLDGGRAMWLVVDAPEFPMVAWPDEVAAGWPLESYTEQEVAGHWVSVVEGAGAYAGQTAWWHDDDEEWRDGEPD